MNEVRVVDGSLVVLMGPSGSGKTTWAVERFGTGPVVSADALRAVVGEGERDVRASTDAFELLEQIVDRRLGRGLLTVVDTLGMDDAWRERWLARARRHGRPAVAVVFDVPEREVRRRNRARPGAVPSKVLTGQLERWAALRPQVDGLGFDEVLAPGAAVVVPAAFAASGAAAARQRAEPVGLRFGLLVGRWDWPGESAALAERLGDLAVEAEQAGFDSLWVMDHLVQVPTVGREWEAMPEAVATLGFLAARTTSLRLGPMVSPVTLRHPAVLGRAVATLDVLSGGRAVCGLGVGSHPDEHLALGLAFPPLATRYELLEDALRFLPLLWGAGAPSFHGHHLRVERAVGYPRPVQERLPLLVGGSGERRTLALAGALADACNLFGPPEVVARKVGVLAAHCAAAGRDPADVAVTHLGTVLCAADRSSLERRVEELRGSDSAARFAGRVNAGTVEDHVGRFRAYAEAGVGEAIVTLADVGRPGSVEPFAAVIERFGADRG